MRTKAHYEWVVEKTDEHGDIQDTNAFDTLKEALAAKDYGDKLCLTVNEGNEEEGVTFREWAYVKDGRLPEHFGDMPSYKVPKRFHREFEKSNNP